MRDMAVRKVGMLRLRRSSASLHSDSAQHDTVQERGHDACESYANPAGVHFIETRC